MVGGEDEVEDVEVELLVSSTFFFFRVFCDVWRASKEFAVTKSPKVPWTGRGLTVLRGTVKPSVTAQSLCGSPLTSARAFTGARDFLQSRDEWPFSLQLQHLLSLIATGGLGHFKAACSSPQLGQRLGGRGPGGDSRATRCCGGRRPGLPLMRLKAAMRSSTELMSSQLASSSMNSSSTLCTGNLLRLSSVRAA